MRKKKREESSSSDGWLATYGDLVTLLLCFFVLLFSFSEINVQKFQAVIESFQGSLGVLDGGETIDENSNQTIIEPKEDSNEEESDREKIELKEMEDFQKLKDSIEEYANEKGLATNLKVEITERGLVIRILDNVFFDSGKAEIKQKAREVILYIGQALKKEEFINKDIRIEGHTDIVPINTPKFPSNWELSVLRATNVLRLLEEEIDINSKRLSASGYGPNRPVAPNDSKENKAKNRRVDIVVLKATER